MYACLSWPLTANPRRSSYPITAAAHPSHIHPSSLNCHVRAADGRSGVALEYWGSLGRTYCVEREKGVVVVRRRSVQCSVFSTSRCVFKSSSFYPGQYYVTMVQYSTVRYSPANICLYGCMPVSTLPQCNTALAGGCCISPLACGVHHNQHHTTTPPPADTGPPPRRNTAVRNPPIPRRPGGTAYHTHTQAELVCGAWRLC